MKNHYYIISYSKIDDVYTLHTNTSSVIIFFAKTIREVVWHFYNKLSEDVGEDVIESSHFEFAFIPKHQKTIKLYKKAYKVGDIPSSYYKECNVGRMFSPYDNTPYFYGNTKDDILSQLKETYEFKYSYEDDILDYYIEEEPNMDEVGFHTFVGTRGEIIYKLNELDRIQKLSTLSHKQIYLVQDTRSFIGNALNFWANFNSGYTSILDRAKRWTKDDIASHFNYGFDLRDTDVIWELEYLLKHTKTIVDGQSINKSKSF